MVDREGDRDRIERLFDPETVAIAGASADPGKRGHTAMRRLIESNFDGAVHPVNPSAAGEILGRPVFASVSEIPTVVDLVYVVTPASAVASVLEDAGQADAAGAVIFSAGFSEAGNDDAERELARIAEAHGIRFLGPNVMGLVNVPADLYLGIDATYSPGGVSVISQSGNLAMNLGMQASREPGAGVSGLVSIGNEADLKFHDLLPYFADSDETETLLLYAEGMADGRAFLQEARGFTREKPIVALKGGRTGAGRDSARSHTASLAGEAAIVDAVYSQAGVATVGGLDELLPVGLALTELPPLSGRNIAVMTEAGGLATVAADALVEAGLAVPTLTSKTQDRLADLFPYSPNVSNPVDTMVTLETPKLHGDAAEAILADPTIDGLLICGEYGGYGLETPDAPDLPADDDTARAQRESAERIADLPREYDKPVVISSSHSSAESEALSICRENGIPVYGTLRYAPLAFRALADYGSYLETADRRTDFVPDPDGLPDAGLTAAGGLDGALTEVEARTVLADHGVPVAPSRLAESPEAAVEAAAAFGESVALKAVSPDVQHKTEAGGVALDVAGESAVRAAYERVVASVSESRPEAAIEGVLVSPMVEGEVEVIVGALEDPEVGPVVMFGLGGVFVEVLDDVAFAAVPLTEFDARQLLDGIDGSALLRGARGRPPVDEDALVDVLLGVSSVMEANPSVTEIDLNPVICDEDGATVVDASVHL